MKNVLVYGDSNTWGDLPCYSSRIALKKRWTYKLGKKLKRKWNLYVDALPGRLAGEGCEEEKFKWGKIVFESVMRVNGPFDMVIIFLGTNDLMPKWKKKSKDIINDLKWYSEVFDNYYLNDDRCKKYLNNKKPMVLYILPPKMYLSECTKKENEKISKKRKDIIDYFSKSNYNVIINDEVSVVEDGIHLSEIGNEEVYKKVYDYINVNKLF